MIAENVVQIKSGTTVGIDVGVKIQWKNVYAKKIMFGTLVHVLVKLMCT